MGPICTVVRNTITSVPMGTHLATARAMGPAKTAALQFGPALFEVPC